MNRIVEKSNLSESPIHNASTQLYSLQFTPNKNQQLGIRKLIEILRCHITASIDKIKYSFQNCLNHPETEIIQGYINALNEFNDSDEDFLKSNLQELGHSHSTSQTHQSFLQINQNICSMNPWRKSIFVLILKLAKICDKFTSKQSCIQLYNSICTQIQQSYYTQEQQCQMKEQYEQQIKRLNKIIFQQQQSRVITEGLLKNINEQLALSSQIISQLQQKYQQLKTKYTQILKERDSFSKQLQLLQLKTKENLLLKQKENKGKIYKSSGKILQIHLEQKNSTSKIEIKSSKNYPLGQIAKQNNNTKQSQIIQKLKLKINRIQTKLIKSNEKLAEQISKSNNYREYIFEVQNKSHLTEKNYYILLNQQIQCLGQKISKICNHIKNQVNNFIKIQKDYHLNNFKNEQKSVGVLEQNYAKYTIHNEFNNGNATYRKGVFKKHHPYIFRQKNGDIVEKDL